MEDSAKPARSPHVNEISVGRLSGAWGTHPSESAGSRGGARLSRRCLACCVAQTWTALCPLPRLPAHSHVSGQLSLYLARSKKFSARLTYAAVSRKNCLGQDRSSCPQSVCQYPWAVLKLWLRNGPPQRILQIDIPFLSGCKVRTKRNSQKPDKNSFIVLANGLSYLHAIAFKEPKKCFTN